MKLLIKRLPSETFHTCAASKKGALHLANIEIHASIELSVTVQLAPARDKIYLCYNCLNTALVDALGHDLITGFDDNASEITKIPRLPKKIRGTTRPETR